MEAIVVCVDNSECTRNSDCEPTRFQAQADAVNLLAGSKKDANVENTVGILTSATLSNKAPKVMVTPTSDMGKVLAAMADIAISGTLQLCKSALIAQLALKHRQNKNQRQRVVLFVGSPIADEQETMVKVGKKLKKNNVSVDVISFGSCVEDNRGKLEQFFDSVAKDGNSHYLEAPIGANLSDCLISSPIVQRADGMGATSTADMYGVDPNIDPELAMVLRMSAEDERARQAAAREAAMASGAGAADSGAAEAAGTVDMDMDVDDDELLQAALRMSMQEEVARNATAQGDSSGAGAGGASGAPAAAGGGSAAPRRPDGSMEVDGAATTPMSASTTEEVWLLRPPRVILQSVQGLPGVDVNDPEVQEAIGAAARVMQQQQGNREEDADNNADRAS